MAVVLAIAWLPDSDDVVANDRIGVVHDRPRALQAEPPSDEQLPEGREGDVAQMRSGTVDLRDDDRRRARCYGADPLWMTGTRGRGTMVASAVAA